MFLIIVLLACAAVAGLIDPVNGLIELQAHQDGGRVLLGLLGAALLVWGVGMGVQLLVRRLETRAAWRRVMVTKLLGWSVPILAYAYLLTDGGYQGWLIGIGVADWPLVGQLLQLLPALFLLAVALHPAFLAQRRQEPSRWTFASYYAFQGRLVIAPLPMLLLLGLIVYGNAGLVAAWPWLARQLFVFPTLDLWLQLLPVAAATAFFPLFLRWILPVERFPDGPARDAMEALAKEAGVPIAQIFLWKTGRVRLVNAMVSGVWGRVRYVFISDHLVERFKPRELQAVFAHELGHAKHFHLTLYLVVLFSLMLLMTFPGTPVVLAIGSMLGLSAGTIHSLIMVVQLGVVAAGLAVFLLMINRRFERQADRFAQSHGPDRWAIVDALNRIDEVHGGKLRNVPVPTHGSLGHRIDILRQTAMDDDLARSVDRRARRWQWGFAAVLAMAVLFQVAAFMIEAQHAASQRLVYDVLRADDPETAAAILESAAALDADNPWVPYLQGVLARRSPFASPADIEPSIRRALQEADLFPQVHLNALYLLEDVQSDRPH